MTDKTDSNRLTRPLLVFSDLHWGQKPKLETRALKEINKQITEKNIVTVLIAGDLLNIDLVQEIMRVGNVQSLVEELQVIKGILGMEKLYLLRGNHDIEQLYRPWKEQIREKAGVEYLGSTYGDDQIRIEHGDIAWTKLLPPLEKSMKEYRQSLGLEDQYLVLGHRHVIQELHGEKMLSNGGIGKQFSCVIVDEESVDLIRIPVEYHIDVKQLMKKYDGYVNAEESIDRYVSKKVVVVEPSTTVADIVERNLQPSESLAIVEGDDILGILHANMLDNLAKNLSPEVASTMQVVELAYPVSYLLQLGQTLKEAWTVLSATGETTLLVVDGEKKVTGKVSIFSIPKAENEQAETQVKPINEKMKKIGEKLTDLLEKKGA